MQIRVTVPGTPVAKGRPKFTRTGHAYTPEKTAKYERDVRACWWEQSRESLPPETPLKATVTAYFEVPKSYSKKKRAELLGKPYTHKPDMDNLVKIMLDALNGKAYEDDNRIAEIVGRKYYAETAHMDIVLEELREDDAEL